MTRRFLGSKDEFCLKTRRTLAYYPYDHDCKPWNARIWRYPWRRPRSLGKKRGSNPVVTAASTLLLAVGIAVLLSALLRHLPGPRAMPSPDRWHRTVTPVTGGIALFGAFVIALQPA